MAESVIDRANELMRAGRFDAALPLLREAIDYDPSSWSAMYMAGQCCRFTDDLEGATDYLSAAVELKNDEPPLYLALGIALQLSSRWDEAIANFARAIELDPDYDLAYNSLALTQKKRGDLAKALHNYDAGAKALSRRVASSMKNDSANAIYKYQDTRGKLWVEYACYAAVSTSSPIERIAWLTGDQAVLEERTERHRGLYWEDTITESNEILRLFFPNYFNTFRERLKGPSYANLIGNRGTVLDLLGRRAEAHNHFDEASEFMDS